MYYFSKESDPNLAREKPVYKMYAVYYYKSIIVIDWQIKLDLKDCYVHLYNKNRHIATYKPFVPKVTAGNCGNIHV